MSQSRLASAGKDGVVRLFDQHGVSQRELGKHPGGAFAVAFSPDGRWVASGGWDSQVRLWQTDGGIGPVLSGHAAQISAVAWHPDGDRLASSSWDGTLRIWSASGRAEHKIIKAHAGRGVRGVAWSPDGELLASAGADATVRLWRADGAEQAVLGCDADHVMCVAWSSADVIAAAMDKGAVQFWRRDGTPLKTQRLPERSTLSLAWTHDGTRLAAGPWEGHQIRFWDQAGEAVATTACATAPAGSIAWHRAGGIATGSHDHTVRVWDDDGSQRTLLPRHAGQVEVSWNKAGDRLASGSWDHTIRVSDLAGGKPVVFNGHNPLAWNPAIDEIAWALSFTWNRSRCTTRRSTRSSN